ncbi:hypothetical protein L228DRAFT_282906 [Xylona heveae TC161]|uniref:COP9 signalosome complex subunit 6 n=1 Tax=Xylona heveae (strain CBS 132557 / TC161) TaxID=1328760 RepID=A0A165H097_XYLHT|nr:hypothetical protein L228DRAFT_282906 [Xylona heveae TC161]KZF22825.1 hypothetical protein L228DRAFT_282906 [Xylona heveae TC161]
MAENEHNPLLSAHPSSESSLLIHLHPLVLLTISDYITRHTLRNQEGPIVGAILGQQHGREVSLEHAFECKLVATDDGNVMLHQDWFEERLQQFKDVHKPPALDLAGWFTITPKSGPQSHHLPIHRYILHKYNESAVLLAFHPSSREDGPVGGKLPLTIYESIYEGDSHATAGGEAGDNEMQVEGEDALKLRFRELPYSVETGEAEMIGVDFVVRGGGGAVAVDPSTKLGSKKAKAAEKKTDTDSVVLSPEDEELIATLTAKANATRMLHSRIKLIRAYLTSLPPSYLTTGVESTSSTENAAQPTSPQHSEINHTILRSIQALLQRLPLLIPANSQAFEQESLAEKNDVSLVTLLGNLSNGAKDIKELGRKFYLIDNHRQARRKTAGVPEDMIPMSAGGAGAGAYASPTADFERKDGLSFKEFEQLSAMQASK